MTGTPAAQAPTTTVGALPLALSEPSDLAVAVRVAQRMLGSYGRPDYGNHADVAQAHGAVTESLRILLRALGAEPVSEEEAVRRSVDRAFPVVAAFLANERGEDQ